MLLDPLAVELSKPNITQPTLTNPFESMGMVGTDGSFSMLPTVPSGVGSSSPESKEDYLKYLEQSFKSNPTAVSGPLYEVTTQQNKRYDNPYMPYKPSTQGWGNIEDAYGQHQSWLDQLGNGSLKMLANAGVSFVSTFAAIPNQIDSLRKGDVQGALFAEDSTFNSLQNYLRDIEDTLPNYLTSVEQERPWFVNMFTPTGAANFWGDTIIKNAGFTIGAIASGLVVDGALTLLTGGAASEIAVVDFGRRLASIAPKLKNSFGTLSKVGAAGKIDAVVGSMNMGNTFTEALQLANSTIPRAKKIKDLGKLAASTYMSAQGEAMIEGYSTYVETKTQLIEDAISSGKQLTPELLQAIDETSSNAGKNTAIFNAAILSASNLVQIPKILGLKRATDTVKKIDDPFIKGYEFKNGAIEVVNSYSKKQAVKNVIGDVLKYGVLTEGAEEGLQYYVGNTLHDYYIDKFNDPSKAGMFNYMMKAIPKTLEDKDFWKEALIGGISGAMMGGLIPGSEIRESFNKNLGNTKARTQGYKDAIQKNLDLFMDASAGMTNFNEMMVHNSGDPASVQASINRRQTAYKAYHRVIADAARFGNLESLKETLKELRGLDVDVYNDALFDQTVKEKTGAAQKGFKTVEEKNSAIDFLLNEADAIQTDIGEVEEFFKDNPFADPTMMTYLKDKFKLNEEQLKNAQNVLFADWKKNQVYLLGRLRNLKDEQNNFTTDLKLATGLNQEETGMLATTLMGMNSEKTLSAYLSFKQRLLQSLDTQIDLYSSTNQDTTEMKKRADSMNLLLKKLDVYLNKLREGQTLSDKELTAIKDAILEEEMGGVIPQDLRAMVDQAIAESKIKENSEEELKQNVNDPATSAKKMADVIEEVTKKEDEADEAEEGSTPYTDITEEERAIMEEQAMANQPEAGVSGMTEDDIFAIGSETPEGIENLDASEVQGFSEDLFFTILGTHVIGEEFSFNGVRLKIVKPRGEGPIIAVQLREDGSEDNITYSFFPTYYEVEGKRTPYSKEDYKQLKINTSDPVLAEEVEYQKQERENRLAAEKALQEDLAIKEAEKKRLAKEASKLTKEDLLPSQVPADIQAQLDSLTEEEVTGKKPLAQAVEDVARTIKQISDLLKSLIVKGNASKALIKNPNNIGGRYVPVSFVDKTTLSLKGDKKGFSVYTLLEILPNNEYKFKEEYIGLNGVKVKIIKSGPKQMYSVDGELSEADLKKREEEAIAAKSQSVNIAQQEGNEASQNEKVKITGLASSIAAKENTTPPFNNLTQDQLKEKFDDLVETKDRIKLPAKDAPAYIDETSTPPKSYKRVTSLLKKAPEQSALLKSATTIGDKIHEFAKDFFTGGIDFEKPNLSKYDFAPQDQVQNLYNQFVELKAVMDERGEVPFSESVIAYDNKHMVAGTIDLITYDAKGRVRIYDFKTMRGNKFIESYSDETGSKYASTKFGKSDAQVHQEQLSVYSILLYNTFGLQVDEMYIVPIQIDYKEGDSTSNVSRALNAVKYNKLKEVKTIDDRTISPIKKEEKKELVVSEKPKQAVNGIEKIVFSDPNIKLEGFEIEGNYWNVITSTGRAKVLVNINGSIVPFYLTSGQAGKGLIPGWYPFFGVGSDGWLNKTDKSDMESYYERYWGKNVAGIIRSVSEELNNFYGTDPANFKNDADPNTTDKPLSSLMEKSEDYINSKLSYKPTENDENARQKLRANVEKLGKEISNNYKQKEATQQKPEETTPNLYSEISAIEMRREQELQKAFPGMNLSKKSIEILAERSDPKAVAFIEKYDKINSRFDEEISALERKQSKASKAPTRDLTETIKEFLGNNQELYSAFSNAMTKGFITIDCD
jgi:hypothetical protein